MTRKYECDICKKIIDFEVGEIVCNSQKVRFNFVFYPKKEPFVNLDVCLDCALEVFNNLTKDDMQVFTKED